MRGFVSRAAKSGRNRVQTLIPRLRGSAFRMVNAAVCSCGPGLRMGRGVTIEVYGDLRLGSGVKLSDGCSLTVAPGATLDLGDEVFIGRGSVVVAQQRIVMGARTLIGEHCSVRDADHGLDAGERAAELAAEAAHASPTLGPKSVTAVNIGDDVWIGAGVRVLRGAELLAGCVVAANAVVRGRFGPRHVIGGVPARVLRELEHHA